MTQPKPITVLVAEDHEIVRQGLCGLLELHGQFQITGEARNGREAVELAQTLRPDVILMDVTMPVLNGLEATREIIATWPAARILILSAHSDAEYEKRATQAGAVGFLQKQGTVDSLTKALAEIAQVRSPRKQPAEPGQRKDVSAGHSPQLTTRETEVLQLVAGGASNKQVSSSLGIGIKMVEKLRHQIMDKTHLHDLAGLIRYAISAGVIPNQPQPKRTP